MDKKVSWGILGCANIAKKVVIPSLLKANNAVLYAVASRNDDKLEDFRRFNAAKYYKSYEELLDDPSVDAVYIPLPNGFHREWVVKACEKKKFVLCEKPMGLNEEEVNIMHDAAVKNGVVVMEAFAYLHSPLIPKIKEVLREGSIGKANYVDSSFSFILDDLSNVRLDRNIGGGTVYDLGCYTVSFLIELFGEEPETVNVLPTTGEQSGVDEDVLIQMAFPSGMKANSYVSFRSYSHCVSTIIGDKGVIEIPVGFNASGKLEFFVKTSSGREVVTVDCPDNYLLEIEQMGRVILNGEEPHVGYGFSLKNARVLDIILSQINR